MKYPERLARRGSGSRPFHSVIATTFSIEFAACEEVLLPQLMASGASNLLMIADERMASMSLSDGSQLPTQLGRDYELVSPPVADGLFHPKIVLQLGRRAGRLFVGSANITAAGLAGNAETVLELECQDEPGPERAIVRSAWRYVSSLVPQHDGAAREALNWAAARAPWLSGDDDDPVQELEDGTAIAFLARRRETGIGGRFLELVGSHSVDRLVVASPYWDRLEALNWLSETLSPIDLMVLLDGEGHEFPLDAARPANTAFRTFPSRLDGRFKHAKFLIASTQTHDHLLVGSANCTAAALGGPGFRGANQEACIYRRLPRDRAIEVLGLVECLNGEAVDPAELHLRIPRPPIPLEELGSRKGGVFALEGVTLTWTVPPSIKGNGRLGLLDTGGAEILSIPFEIKDDRGTLGFELAIEKPERISFAVVEQAGFVSNRAHVTHRSLLRRRRREVATGSLAKAVAAFDAGEEFELWMLGAFEELARADLDDRPARPIAAARPRQGGKQGEEEPVRELSYEEFMEVRSLDSRDDGRSESTLVGSHSDSVRSFLNMLVGRAPPSSDPAKDPSEDVTDDWLDLGDEDQDEMLDAETQRLEENVPPGEDQSSTRPAIDKTQVEKMVRLYAAKVRADDGPLGPSDVLRVRFWLMMLLMNARHQGNADGLEPNSEEHGWPRLALRIIAAFFCGKGPPITRLMIARDYTGMPIDFLECWATVLWTLDAIERLLASSPRERQFLAFVEKARIDVVRILALTPAELASDTVVEMKAALDRTLGSRLN